MSKPIVKIISSYADGKSLSEFKNVLAKRQHYLNETAFQSIHAMAMDTLKSLRGLVRVAKVSDIKVNITPRSDLKFSYYFLSAAKTGNKSAARMCIRAASSDMRFERDQIGKEIYANVRGVKLAAVQVYQFKDKDGDNQIYLICATSQAKAKQAARRIVARRLLRYAGLARRAISALMVKTNSKGPADNVAPRVYAKANEVTEMRNIVARDTQGSGGQYALVLEDNLRYAVRALNGGRSAVNLALQKAANKSIGLIKKRCDGLLLPGEIKTPFPEIKKR